MDNALERYIKALAGPNPKEEGIPPEVLKTQLQARMRIGLFGVASAGAVGLLIIAYATGQIG